MYSYMYIPKISTGNHQTRTTYVVAALMSYPVHSGPYNQSYYIRCSMYVPGWYLIHIISMAPISLPIPEITELAALSYLVHSGPSYE